MAKERTQDFYNDNEKKVMSALGLMPTPASGAGWVHKEDGENDYILSQLKSTDKNSLTIKYKDWTTLKINSDTAHKLPLFVVQKLENDNDQGVTLICMRPEDILNIAKYIATGEKKQFDAKQESIMNRDLKQRKKKVVPAGNSEKYHKESQKEWEKKRENRDGKKVKRKR